MLLSMLLHGHTRIGIFTIGGRIGSEFKASLHNAFRRYLLKLTF
jgi:hypothetical protein